VDLDPNVSCPGIVRLDTSQPRHLVIEGPFKASKGQYNIKYIYSLGHPTIQPTSQSRMPLCVLQMCENTTSFPLQSYVSFKTLLYIVFEVDWDP
jgi:hypothetical protein